MIAENLTGIVNSDVADWKIAEDQRTNSSLDSREWCVSILGLQSSRHALNFYCSAKTIVKADRAASKRPKRPSVKTDFVSDWRSGLRHEGDAAHFADTCSSI